MTQKEMGGEFVGLMCALAKHYEDRHPVVMDEEKIKFYWEHLGKYDLGGVSRAINAHLADPDKCGFFPMPGDIIRHIPATKDLGRNMVEKPVHESASGYQRLPTCFDMTKPRGDRLLHINSLLAMSDDALAEQGYGRSGLTFLKGLMDAAKNDEEVSRDRLRRRHGLEPLAPDGVRDQMRAEYMEARDRGNFDKASELIGQLVTTMPEATWPELRPAHEGLLGTEQAKEIGEAQNVPKRTAKRKGGATRRIPEKTV